MRRHLARVLVGICCMLAVFGHVAHWWRVPAIVSLDAYLYDIRLRFSVPGGQDERVVIVDIDEKSLDRIGHWPWGRNHMAELVRYLADEGQAAAIGFDIVFAEADTTSGLASLDALGQRKKARWPGLDALLQQLRPSLDFDQQFADALLGRPVLLGYYFNHTPDYRAGQLPVPDLPAGSLAGFANSPSVWQGYGGNLPLLQAAAAGAGHFNPLLDSDGVSRRVPLLVEFDGGYYQSLSLAVLRRLLDDAALFPGVPEGGREVEWLELLTDAGTLKIPVDESLAALVPFRGPERSFTYYSALDVLSGQIPKAAFQGRVVLVGTSAPGLKDLRATPVGTAYPGVELHANLIAGALDGQIKERPRYVMGIEFTQLLLAGGLLVLILPFLGPARATLLFFVVLLGLLACDYYFWTYANLVLPLASGLLLIGLLYMANMAWGFFVESRSKRLLTARFGQYVPPELVAEMARDPESYSMAGQTKELTILFSDVRDFTTLSEGLPAHELSALMNAYLGEMTEIIRTQRGTLDKYIGDAIMAFWGAPLDDPAHARHAVLAALEMQSRVRLLDEPFSKQGWPPLHVGIGINTGMATVGDMGSPVRQAYTALGDSVNLASRLEGITKAYGVGIVVGELTCQHVTDVVFRELDRVRVKGKQLPVGIYEPLGLKTSLSPVQFDDLQRWAEALAAYRAQLWDKAEVLLNNLQAKQPCRLYSLYLERIALLRIEPPGESWDGVAVFKTK